MEPKSAVSALDEFWEKSKCAPLVFNYTKVEGSGHNCKVILINQEGYGTGGSKVHAQEVAASNLLEKLRKIPECSDLLKTDDAGESNEFIDPNRDMYKELCDFCQRLDMPFPIIDFVEESQSPNGPKFVASCVVASTKRYGISDKKKDARQRAAAAVFSVISKDGDKLPDTNGIELISIGAAKDEESQQRPILKQKNKKLGRDEKLNLKLVENGMKRVDIGTGGDEEYEQRQIFKKYHTLSQARKRNFPKETRKNIDRFDSSMKLAEVALRDRHNYFKCYPENLKLAALEILDPSNDANYPDVKTRALKAVRALNLTPTISTVPSRGKEPMLMIEFDCEYDVVIIDLKSRIYSRVIQYFRGMLV